MYYRAVDESANGEEESCGVAVVFDAVTTLYDRVVDETASEKSSDDNAVATFDVVTYALYYSHILW